MLIIVMNGGTLALFATARIWSAASYAISSTRSFVARSGHDRDGVDDLEQTISMTFTVLSPSPAQTCVADYDDAVRSREALSAAFVGIGYDTGKAGNRPMNVLSLALKKSTDALVRSART